MPRVASLGMYDGAGARAANDLLWRVIARRLRDGGVRDVPETLDRRRPLDAIWSDPELLFAQCCGYPLMTRYRDRLRVVATPRYAVEGCEDGFYRSRLIVSADDSTETLGDFRGARAAINDRSSNSGMNLFRAAVAPHAGGARFFGSVMETGSHLASVRAVRDSRADIAAIDAVSFAHIRRDEPGLAARVRTLGWTATSPGLPFVTARETPDDVVRILYETLIDLHEDKAGRSACAALMMNRIGRPYSYEQVIDIERDAERSGYPVLI